jgi:hypothetical protein
MLTANSEDTTKHKHDCLNLNRKMKKTGVRQTSESRVFFLDSFGL